MVAFGPIAAYESLYIVENRIFAKKITDNLGHVSVKGLVVGHACAECICEADVSGAVSAEETRDAERRIRAKCERIDKVIINAAVDHIHAAQSPGGAHIHDVVVNGQIAALHQLDSHLTGKKRVLEVRGIEDARRE